VDLIKNIATFINPFGTIAVLLLAVLVLLFFANSKKNGLKTFIFIFTILAFAGAFIVNIAGFLRNGAFSDNLFTSGIAQIIEISYILIISLIIFIIIFVFNRSSESFLKLALIFLFSSSALIFFTISRNFIAFFASLVFFLISLFALITLISETDVFVLKNRNITRKSSDAEYHSRAYMSISKFFLAVLFSVLFIFFGTSLLYGVSDFKNFIQLSEGVAAFKGNLGFVFVIFGIAIYLYFGFFRQGKNH
jgi:NADH:ubiquinone oxidoreductase subunit 2 (subunit N)